MEKSPHKVKTPVPVHERRSYKRTSFFLFIFAMAATLAMEYFGITADQVTKYAGVVVTKTFSNLATFSLFIAPVVVAYKEYAADKEKRQAEKEIQIAEIQKTGCSPPVKPRARVKRPDEPAVEPEAKTP